MNPLDVTMPQAVCCVAGWLGFGPGLIHGSVSVRGHRPALGVRLVRVHPIQTYCLQARCQACVELCLPRREGAMLGHRIVHHAMAKQLPLS